MNTRKWFCAFSLCVLLQTFGTSRTSQAQISIDANSELTAPFTATYNPQNDEIDFSPGGFSLNLSVTLNIALPLPVTFTGSYSPSWGDAANWDGVNLLVTAGSIGVDVFKSAGDGNGVPEWTLAKDVFNALGTTGGPTEKTVTGGIETFKYQTSSKDALLSGSFDLKASLDFKFDVTIPSGKTAIMNQSPVVLEHLINNGNLTGNGNGLTINQDLQNTGVLQSLGGSVAGDFTNSAGASATITSSFSNQGAFQNAGGLIISTGGTLSRSVATTNAGSLAVNGGTVNIQAAFTNTGPMSLISGTVSVLNGFTSTGSIALTNGTITAPGGFINGSTVQGWGTITTPQNTSSIFTNNGTISANSSGNILSIPTPTNLAGTVTLNNHGSLIATNNSTLYIGYPGASIIQDANTTILADNGIVEFNGGSVTSGLLNSANGGYVEATNHPLSLTNVTNNASLRIYSSYVPGGNGIYVSGGSLVNNNTITVNYDNNTNVPYAPFIDFGTGVNLSGNGEIYLQGGIVRSTGTVTVGASQTIDGWGSLTAPQNNTTTYNNYGTIKADYSGKVLNIPFVTGSDGSVILNNHGSLTATNGATLSIGYPSASVTQDSNTALLADNGVIAFNGGSVTNGSLNAANGGYIEATNHPLSLSNVTNNAPLRIYSSYTPGGNGVYVSGSSFVNNNIITVNYDNNGSVPSAPFIDFGTGVNLSGNGEIYLQGGIARSTGTVTVGIGQTIDGWGSLQTAFNLSGSIKADVSGQTLTIGGGSSSPIINNSGFLGVVNGANLSITSSTVNGGAITAKGGTVSIYATTINGSTLSGDTTDLFTVSGTFDNVVNNARVLSVQGISVLGGSLVNGGTITMGSGSSSPNAILSFSSNSNLGGAGTVILNGGSISGNGTVTQTTGHTLSGAGTVSMPLVNAGTIAPGITFGTLAFNNGLSLNSTSHLVFAIGGSPTTALYDHITVSGTASLNGAVDLKIANNFVPNIGDTFQIMTFGAGTGGFTALNGLIINENLAFSVSVTATAVTLTVVNTDFARWKAAEFGSNASNPAIAGALADPDGDGIPNLLEYAFGLNPNVASQSGLPILGTVQVGSSRYLSLSYRQLIATTQLSYVVGVSGDLQTWDWSEAQIQQVGTPTPTGDGLTEQITVRMNAPINTTARQFMRLSVSESF